MPLIARASALAGAHGVGRIDMIENRLVGIKSREIYETPAAALLLAAYAGVEELVCERDLAHTKQQLALQYATLVYNGLWFSPLRPALQAFMAQATGAVTGTARVKLYTRRMRRGRAARPRRRCTTTAWRPTRRATASSTARPRASSTSGRLPTKTWAAAAAQTDTVGV